MGMFQVEVEVANPTDPKKSFKEKFWVDTGALYTYVPAERLESIDLEAAGTRELTMADGRTDKRLLGEARLTIGDQNETLTCPIIFGPKDSLYLLGATALETFGVDVDPTSKSLKPIFGIIGGHLASKPKSNDR